MQANPETLREQLTRINSELAAAGRPDSFYTSLAASWQRYGSLTERQEAALVRSFAQRAQRQAQRAQEVVTSPIPTGRVTITGEIVSTKWQESRFGGSLKMLLKSEAGWKVWGTVPASISGNDSLKGRRVTFTAQIEPKEAAFGFFSRPTNARLLDEAQKPAGKIVPAGEGDPLHPVPAIVARPADIVCTNKSTFAPAPKLADIIAKAKVLEAAKNAPQAWDTDSMTEAERPAAWINATTCE